ncbi:hypothetical protein DIPPA_22659 [Diplonema papillatum]|nr:hypothetical protein DIPPA_22659 [Diplonema papillatum]
MSWGPALGGPLGEGRARIQDLKLKVSQLQEAVQRRRDRREGTRRRPRSDFRSLLEASPPHDSLSSGDEGGGAAAANGGGRSSSPSCTWLPPQSVPRVGGVARAAEHSGGGSDDASSRATEPAGRGKAKYASSGRSPSRDRPQSQRGGSAGSGGGGAPAGRPERHPHTQQPPPSSPPRASHSLYNLARPLEGVADLLVGDDEWRPQDAEESAVRKMLFGRTQQHGAGTGNGAVAADDASMAQSPADAGGSSTPRPRAVPPRGGDTRAAPARRRTSAQHVPASPSHSYVSAGGSTVLTTPFCTCGKVHAHVSPCRSRHSHASPIREVTDYCVHATTTINAKVPRYAQPTWASWPVAGRFAPIEIDPAENAIAGSLGTVRRPSRSSRSPFRSSRPAPQLSPRQRYTQAASELLNFEDTPSEARLPSRDRRSPFHRSASDVPYRRPSVSPRSHAARSNPYDDISSLQGFEDDGSPQSARKKSPTARDRGPSVLHLTSVRSAEPSIRGRSAQSQHTQPARREGSRRYQRSSSDSCYQRLYQRGMELKEERDSAVTLAAAEKKWEEEHEATRHTFKPWVCATSQVLGKHAGEGTFERLNRSQSTEPTRRVIVQQQSRQVSLSRKGRPSWKAIGPRDPSPPPRKPPKPKPAKRMTRQNIVEVTTRLYSPRQPPAPTASEAPPAKEELPKKKRTASVPRKRALSDVKGPVERLFELVDADKNGFWSFEEAVAWGRVTRGQEMTESDWNSLCMLHGASPAVGLSLQDVKRSFPSPGVAARHYGAVVRHNAENAKKVPKQPVGEEDDGGWGMTATVRVSDVSRPASDDGSSIRPQSYTSSVHEKPPESPSPAASKSSRFVIPAESSASIIGRSGPHRRMFSDTLRSVATSLEFQEHHDLSEVQSPTAEVQHLRVGSDSSSSDSSSSST